MNAGEILSSTYEIREQIGSGSGGTIYRAYHRRLQKDVVLKKINQSSERNEDEKEILKNLKHSYLPQVYDFLDVEDGVYTIIDYIPGQSFEKLLKEKGKFPQKKVVKYAMQLCEVVDYLHKQKPPIIHGDIKPANIMLTPEDNICLIDFNISGVLDGKSKESIGYTPGYAPPEQMASFQKAVSMQEQGIEGLKADITSRNFEKAKLPGAEAAAKLLDIDEKTELLAADEKTELFDADEKSELLDADERTELLGTDERRSLLAGNALTKQPGAGSNSVQNQQEYTAFTQQNQTAGVRESDARQVCYVDARSDVYSIGATLYHFLTGVKPGGDANEIVKPSEIDPSIGESISLILMKSLAREPRRRFQTAESMLKAFQKIHKYDFRYKKMVLQQELIFLATAAGIGVGILLIFFGKGQLDREKEEAYMQVVDMLSDARVDGTEEQIEEAYNAAREIKPQRLEAYFQKALYYYEKREYEEGIQFIEDMILSENAFFDQELITDVYFLLGNCQFETGQYEEAVISYEAAISRDDSRPEFYRDYVISLVRDGKMSKAEEVLRQAGEKGISSVDLLLVNGELKKTKGDYEGAKQDLKQCINETENDEIRMRAYILCDMVYREQYEQSRGKEVVCLQKSMELLEEARTRVGLNNQLLIYERLAQTYIDLQELTQEEEYGENAISILREVIDRGWGTYLTYNNIAIMYQKMGKLPQAQEILEQMLELDTENYNTYKRFAFLEAERQSKKQISERNYEDFVQYYEKAKELYEASSVSTDVEIQLLDNLYQQIVEGGWLK